MAFAVQRLLEQRCLHGALGQRLARVGNGLLGLRRIADHAIGLDQARPADRVVAIGLQALGELVDHAADHFGLLLGGQPGRLLHLARARPVDGALGQRRRLAVETVDRCVGELYEACRANGVTMLVTADHGNCETMVDPETGEPHTAHTTNPVPCWLVGESYRDVRLREGILADVAPTLLELMGLPQPDEMTGRSLILS